MNYIIQLLILCILLFAINTQAQHYSFEEKPEWVKEVKIPSNITTNKYDVSNGYYVSLFDIQVNGKTDEQYFHQVVNVVSYSGITNASQISISFDSSYQELNINSLYIWREGKKIDYTKELTIEILNNEKQLHQGIYSGVINAYDILNDIRKGDLIDLSYTLIGSNPIFNKEKFGIFPLEFGTQIDAIYYRFLLPKEKKYNYRFNNCDSSLFTDSLIDGYREIIIHDTLIEVKEYDEMIPSWVMPSTYFTLSSYNSWGEVDSWAQGVFDLNEEPNLDVVFKEIFVGGESQEQKINKIINYVQDDIRYMGIESGIGSIKPFPPEQVVKQRFGDCKDKSLLLVSLLKQIGVKEAYPALVSTAYQHNVANVYPTGHVFNHCITMFKIDNVEYWVDPTASLQGGSFKNMYCFNYGKALVVGFEPDSLYSMVDSKVLSENFFIDSIVVESFSLPAKLTTLSIRLGKNADERRMMMEYVPIDKLLKSIIEKKKEVYPKIEETKDVLIEDDIVNNKFSMTYYYEIKDHWSEGSELGEAYKDYTYSMFRPQVIKQYISKNVCTERKYDMALEYPLNIKYRVVFSYPKEMVLDDNYKESDNEYFFYSEKIEQLSSKSFQLDYEFRIKQKSIKAEDYIGICEEINEISKGLYLVIYFEK